MLRVPFWGGPPFKERPKEPINFSKALLLRSCTRECCCPQIELENQVDAAKVWVRETKDLLDQEVRLRGGGKGTCCSWGGGGGSNNKGAGDLLWAGGDLLFRGRTTSSHSWLFLGQKMELLSCFWANQSFAHWEGFNPKA